MNIFVLDQDVEKAAQYHMDVHVIKQILETAQMLSTCHFKVGSSYQIEYKATHINHGCNTWLTESLSNYVWLCNLGLELCKEFRYRRGKEHKTEAVILNLARNLPPIDDIGLTEHYKAVGDDPYLRSLPVVDCYRQYYMLKKQYYTRKVRGGGEKRVYASWTKRPVPEWFITDRE